MTAFGVDNGPIHGAKTHHLPRWREERPEAAPVMVEAKTAQPKVHLEEAEE